MGLHHNEGEYLMADLSKFLKIAGGLALAAPALAACDAICKACGACCAAYEETAGAGCCAASDDAMAAEGCCAAADDAMADDMSGCCAAAE